MATGAFRDIAKAMHKRAADLEPELKAGVEECTRLVWQVSKDRMQELIYANPPDTNKGFYRGKTGKKARLTDAWRERAKRGGRRGGKGFKWTQTHNLLASEQKRTRGLDGWITNAAKAKKGGGGYARARHNLSVTDPELILHPPPKKKRKSTRIAPFRALAIRDTHERRKAIMRGRVQKVLTV